MMWFRSPWPRRFGRRATDGRPAAVGLVLMLAPGLAEAGTLGPFVPGGSPCREAISIDRAAAFQVAPVEPAPMVLPARSLLMTCAPDGAPFVDRRGLATLGAHDGVGERRPEGRAMFRIRACGNWTIASLPCASAGLAGPSPIDTMVGRFSTSGPARAPDWSWLPGGGAIVDLPGGPRPVSGPGPGDPGGPPRGPGPRPGVPVVVIDPVDLPPDIALPIPVPLPWAGVLLLVSLGLLLRRRW